MPEPLSPLEQRVYHYMIDFLAEHTYQPSIREIAKQFRIKSTKTVSDLLHALSNKGYIERDQSRSRGVRILGLAAAQLTQPVPVYDGAPFTEEQRNGYVTMDRRFLPTEDVVFARASNDNRELGILAGDHVLIAPRADATNGELIAADDGGGVAVRAPADDVPASRRLGVVAGIFRPMAEQAPAPMLPISDAQAAAPVS